MSCAGVIGCPEATSSHVDLPELAAANKSTRVARRMSAARPFFGAQVLGVVYSRKRARLAAASGGWCDRVPFGCAGSVFAFLTREACPKKKRVF